MGVRVSHPIGVIAKLARCVWFWNYNPNGSEVMNGRRSLTSSHVRPPQLPCVLSENTFNLSTLWLFFNVNMPRDVSSSSSEDEADSPAQKSPVKQKESGKLTHTEWNRAAVGLLTHR